MLKGKWDHIPTTMFRRLSMINLLPPDVCVSPKWWCPKTTKLGSQDIATITSVSSGGLPSRPCTGEDFRNVVREIRTPSGSLLDLRNRVITKNIFCFQFLLCWLHPWCGIPKISSDTSLRHPCRSWCDCLPMLKHLWNSKHGVECFDAKLLVQKHPL